MNPEKYIEIIEERLKSCKSTLLDKAVEYARNNDSLHTFNQIAKRENKHPLQVLDELNAKHLSSFKDMIEDVKAGKNISEKTIHDKIGDIINYFLIAETIVIAHNEQKV